MAPRSNFQNLPVDIISKKSRQKSTKVNLKQYIDENYAIELIGITKKVILINEIEFNLNLVLALNLKNSLLVIVNKNKSAKVKAILKAFDELEIDYEFHKGFTADESFINRIIENTIFEHEKIDYLIYTQELNSKAYELASIKQEHLIDAFENNTFSFLYLTKYLEKNDQKDKTTIILNIYSLVHTIEDELVKNSFLSLLSSNKFKSFNLKVLELDYTSLEMPSKKYLKNVISVYKSLLLEETDLKAKKISKVKSTKNNQPQSEQETANKLIKIAY
jgi:hypothetical protein